MAKAMTARTLQSSASNSAAGTTTGSSLDVRVGFGMMVTAKITNGATGPTIACDFILDISNDNSAWKTFVQQTSQLGNNQVTEFAVEVPPTVMFVRSRFTGNTGQAVTVEAFGHEWTTLS